VQTTTESWCLYSFFFMVLFTSWIKIMMLIWVSIFRDENICFDKKIYWVFVRFQNEVAKKKGTKTKEGNFFFTKKSSIVYFSSYILFVTMESKHFEVRFSLALGLVGIRSKHLAEKLYRKKQVFFCFFVRPTLYTVLVILFVNKLPRSRKVQRFSSSFFTLVKHRNVCFFMKCLNHKWRFSETNLLILQQIAYCFFSLWNVDWSIGIEKQMFKWLKCLEFVYTYSLPACFLIASQILNTIWKLENEM